MNTQTDTAPLRILIASTPKTGNTWLANLMADIYGLPIRELPLEFTLEQIEQLGPRWVMIQHVLPKASLLNWLRHNNVHLLTTLRHPCDTLVSLMHYATGLALIPEMEPILARAMTGDWGKCGPNVTAFVRTYFRDYVRLSAEWLWLTDSIGVRYEDLWRDPVGVVQAVTQRICEVPLDRIERSVERCDLSLMRSLAGKISSFFRKGGSGHWKDELPAEVVDIFRHEPPYPQLFAALGYSLDADERAKPARTPRRLQNPFIGVEQFDNGAPILPFMKAAYWHIDPHTASNFAMPISRTDPEGTFWAWLNAPAHDDPHRNAPDLPIISQIARWVYDVRPDLQQALPDIYGTHRIRYIDWYIRQAHIEMKLSEAYIWPVFERYVTWGNAPASGYNRDASLPPLTNLMVALPEQYEHLRKRFPDIAGPGRLEFVVWFLTSAQREYLLDATFIEMAQKLFTVWANSPAPEDVHGGDQKKITCAMLHVYRASSWLPQKFPNIFGRDRRRFLDWFRRLGQWQTLFYPVYRVPMSQADLAWASAPADKDRHRRPGDPPISNLMAWIYDTRSDVQQKYPDIFGADRLDYAIWIMTNASLEYAEGEIIAQPLLEWFTANRPVRTAG